jgi:alpha-tubulin suppressor-like RCC1 family protein
MPTFYNYIENGVVYSFDDVFVPADAFRDGNLFVWGRNTFGELGININDGVTRTSPVEISGAGANWKQISSTGYRHSAAVKTDGTLWAWGRNSYGSVGDGTTINKISPVRVGTATTWKQVDCGFIGYHTAAVKTDGTLWCWGRNANGQLGDNTITQKVSPVQTSTAGTNWKQVSCGSAHTAAIKTDGTLWTWGNNNRGQLGTNNTTQRLIPGTTTIAGTTWKQVSCGYAHTGAIKTDGTLWLWGFNLDGQLGNGSSGTDSLIPFETSLGGTNWKQVSCGRRNTAAIKTDGTLWLWGANGQGQLGNGTNVGPVTTPIQTSTGGANWKQVACGFYSTLAVKTDGTLWTWGGNYGTLGDGTSNNRNTPGQTSLAGTNWKQASVGYRNAAATTYVEYFYNPYSFWLLGEQDFSGQINGGSFYLSSGIFTSANITAPSAGSTTLLFNFIENVLDIIQGSTSYIKLYKNSLPIFTFTRSQGLTTTYSVSYNTNDVFYFETELYVYNGIVNPGIGTIQVNVGSSLVYKYTMEASLD